MSLCTSGVFYFLLLRAHVLSGGNKGVPVPVLLDHSWTVIVIVFVHICRRKTHPVQERLQETHTYEANM